MGLIFQIHTGMQGNWGHVPDSNPLDLLELIRAHRSVRFDLFHAGYPYARELGVVGKHYPNVWLNACWIYLITMGPGRSAAAPGAGCAGAGGGDSPPGAGPPGRRRGAGTRSSPG